MLIENNGEVVSREELIKEVWGNYGNGNEYLTHSICLLRSLMDKSVIKTVPKKGYVLNAHLKQKSISTKRLLNKVTFSKVAAILVVIFFLKMLIFPHH